MRTVGEIQNEINGLVKKAETDFLARVTLNEMMTPAQIAKHEALWIELVKAYQALVR